MNDPWVGGGRKVTAPHQRTVNRWTALFHDQVDPPVGLVAFAFDDPVAVGIELSHHGALDRVADQLVIRLEERGERLEELLEGVCPLPDLLDAADAVLAAGELGVGCLDGLDELGESARIGLDLAGGIVVLDQENPEALIRVRGQGGKRRRLEVEKQTGTSWVEDNTPKTPGHKVGIKISKL
jgi:hypothetical protein